MQNAVQLITYADRLGGSTLADLKALLEGPLQGVFGGVHLLPFFHPIDGADAGYDPIDHTQVDARLGNWTDIASLAEHLTVMADVIVNHISSDSPQFRDFSERGRASRYDGMFLTLDSVFPEGATEADLLRIYRPRPGLPFSCTTLANGERRILWTTFTPQQVDLNVEHPEALAYLDEILSTLARSGVRMIRLDAIGYAVKKAGGSCFMMPETQAFVDQFAARAKGLGLQVLLEVHAHYEEQLRIAKRVDWVYDFALPPLVLHALLFRTAKHLQRWIGLRPVNALTVLDTHDGIGIIDIGPDHACPEEKPGLVPADELDQLVERIHANSGGQSLEATGAAASNLDLYQVNCTFYDALGRDDRAYLLARALQFFLPGIPQVYYVGLLAGANDMSLLGSTGIGRDINRRRYTRTEVEEELERPVVKKLLELIRMRNTHPAFQGAFTLEGGDERTLALRWTHGAHSASLEVDFRNLDSVLKHSDGRMEQRIHLP